MRPEAQTVDGSIVSPQEQLIEKLHTEARYDLADKETKAEKVRRSSSAPARTVYSRTRTILR
jgi:hypothetical protein